MIDHVSTPLRPFGSESGPMANSDTHDARCSTVRWSPSSGRAATMSRRSLIAAGAVLFVTWPETVVAQIPAPPIPHVTLPPALIARPDEVIE